METSFLSQKLWKRRKRKSKEVYQTLRLKSAFRGFIEESSKKQHLSGSEERDTAEKEGGRKPVTTEASANPTGESEAGVAFQRCLKVANRAYWPFVDRKSLWGRESNIKCVSFHS